MSVEMKSTAILTANDAAYAAGLGPYEACLDCHVKPRWRPPNGRLHSRCEDCERKRRDDQRAKALLATIPPEDLCIECHRARRHVWSSGTRESRCHACHMARHRRYEKNARLAHKTRHVETDRGLTVAEPVMVAPAFAEEPTGRIDPPVQSSELVYALLAEMTMLVDRSREAVAAGQVAVVRLALDLPEGVRLVFSSEKVGA